MYSFVNDQKPNLVEKLTVCYSRVSSYDQKSGLVRQTSSLVAYCQKQRFLHVESIADLGSGLNMKKPGLKTLLRLLLNGEVERIILTHKDRLLRFGADLTFSICIFFNVEVIILEEEITTSFEEELARDVVIIITVFTAKLYGRRFHQKRKQRTFMEAAA